MFTKTNNMSTFEREQREHLENLAYEEYMLHNKHLERVEEEEQIGECEDILIAYMGLDEFKKLSKDNLNMIIGAMIEYADNK